MTTEHEQCAACGFDGSRFDDEALIVGLRTLGGRWRGLLGSAADHLRDRPAPEVWSAIEYAAHSRDVLALHAFGVREALERDEPSFDGVDDGLADAASSTYRDEDPSKVIAELGRQADLLATIAEDAGTFQWSRGLTIGSNRSDIRRLLEHAYHDSLHHIDDVVRGLVTLGNQGPTVFSS